MSVGSAIRKRRRAAKMTQMELARRVCVHQSRIAQIERDSKPPTLQLAAEIANVLKCDVRDFLSEASGE